MANGSCSDILTQNISTDIAMEVTNYTWLWNAPVLTLNR